MLDVRIPKPGRDKFAGKVTGIAQRLHEKVVNAAVEDALGEAERLLVARLGAISLAELSREFDELGLNSGELS